MEIKRDFMKLDLTLVLIFLIRCQFVRWGDNSYMVLFLFVCLPYFLVKCHFEDGFCGMKHASKPYRWQIGSGSTPTKLTGPRFDHTTLLPSGK